MQLRYYKHFFIAILVLACLNTRAQVTVSGSTGANGTYTTLTLAGGAFAAINAAGSQSGNNIVLTITANITTESGANSLNAGTWTSLTITPSGARSISGSVVVPLINLNGADNVTINGLNTGGNSLTIANNSTSATAGTSTIRFIADASNNTINNCTISGSGIGATNGTILFSTGTTTGNDNNTIQNSTISEAGANLPVNAIYSAGSSTSVDNSDITISNNNIEDYYIATAASNGILVASNSSAWTISGNKFYQSATRTCTNTGYAHRAINIITASGVNYTVSNNIIGYANSSGTGVTTYDGLFRNRFIGIEMTVGTATASSIQGNTITAISLTHKGALSVLTAPGTFCGISILEGKVNIGTTTGNTVGAATGTGAVTITINDNGHYLAGIYATSTDTINIQNNTIGSINVADPADKDAFFHGINTEGTGNFTVSSNLIGSLSTANSIAVGTSGVSTHISSFSGITNSATGTISLASNTIQNCTSYGIASSTFNGINNLGGTGTLAITGNSIISCTQTGTAAFTGIANSAAPTTLNITSNIIRSLTKSAATGTFAAIQNSGAVTTSININSNQLGNASGGVITYSAANSAALIGINNTGGTAACALTIQSNDIWGITHSVQGTNAHTYILNSVATLSQNISNNTFTNLDVNTTGNIIFISNDVVLSATGTKNVESNSISGTFTRASAATSGSISIISGTATSVAGGLLTHANNNFSNITVSGAATITGWSLTDAGDATLSIRDNTFSNWTGGTGALTGMSLALTNTNQEVKNNTISNFTCDCAITGISAGAGNNKIFSNTISTLSVSGTATTITGIANTAGTSNSIYLNTISGLTGNSLTTGAITGIAISGGTTVNVYGNTISILTANSLTSGTINGVSVSAGATVSVYKNKIYDLSTSSAGLTGTLNGVVVSGTIATRIVNIYNNLIGDLRVTAGSGADLIRGISIISLGTNSTNNVYYNTIYLNASSSGTNFGSSGVYHLVNATATIANLDLRNNIITNMSTPNGTGNTVVFRRSGTDFSNYATTSDNNLFYAGTPGTFRVIFFDGTNKDQTLAAYQTRVGGGIDAVSVTENLIAGGNFLSVTGSNANYLHMNPGVSSLAENAGIAIVGFSTDYDDQSRDYLNTDIGADEYTFRTPFSGTYNVGTGQVYATLTGSGGLFDAINNIGMGGNVTVNITSNITEDGYASLNQWTEYSGSGYKLTIKPSSASVKTISGSYAGGLIRFAGGDMTTVDGRFSGSGSFLTFSNSSTNAAASTFLFSGDAKKDSVINCTIEGSCPSLTNGIILFSTGVTTGNDSICISGCTIKPAGANLPYNAIYSAGTSTAVDNSAISIINNNIQDYYIATAASNGILVASNSSAWTISGNKFYQSATRTCTNTGYAHRAINIITASGVNYTVSNNIIGYANSSGTGVTTYDGLFRNRFIGIEMTVGTATASSIQGNTITAISLTHKGALSVLTAPGTFCGISILEGKVNIGTTTGNTVGAATGTGAVTITINDNGHYLAGIYATSTDTINIQNNTIGSINVADPADKDAFFHGINTEGTGNFTVSSNLIGSLSTANSIAVGTSGVSTHISSFSGITNSATGTISLASNTIQNCTSYGIASSTFNGINNLGGTGTLAITGNSIISCTQTGTAAFTGIANSAAPTTLNITSNIIRSLTKSAATGTFAAIQNSGAVTTSININSNQLGNASGGVITYSAANSAALIGINNTGGTAACALTINSNDIRGITHSVQGTNAHTYILNSAATLSQTITSNTFTNLNVNTTGNIIFISNDVVLSDIGIKNVQSNSISGTFTRASAATSGSISIISGTATSVAGGLLTHANNNFSNITVSGAATITGWALTDAGDADITIENNTFSNWTGGTGALTGMNIALTNTNQEVKNNTISNFTCDCAITGISAGAGNNKIFSNTISALSSSGTATNITGIANTAGTSNSIYLNTISGLTGNSLTTGAITGIAISGGTTVNAYQNTISTLTANSLTSGTINGVSVSAGVTIGVYKNKIYDLSTSSTGLTGTVNGAVVSGAVASLTVNIHNNLIGDLRVTAASGADLIRGISVISTGTSSITNVYYNTLYLNASSSGTNFGSSGIYHTVNTNATTSKLDLRNNSVTNTSTPNGTGNTVVFRRSGTDFSNYATTSDNNLFYAGTPGTFRVIFFDGTNKDQTLAAYQIRVGGGIDAVSVTQDLITGNYFYSVTGSNALYLHLDTSKNSAAENGGIAITGFDTDFDDDGRDFLTTDIGADEYTFRTPLSGNYNVGSGQTYTTLTGVGGLFDIINNAGVSGNITVYITSDLTELGLRSLNQWTEYGGSGYKLSIKPSSASLKTISGNYSGALIRFSGADRTTIDGRYSGSGNYLTFSNSSTGATASTFQFSTDAKKDSLINCTIEGSSLSLTNGTILFSTGVTTGNDSICINGCTIKPAGVNLPFNAIYSAGTSTAVDNSAISIINNNIQDYFKRDKATNGIIIASNSSLWTITGNKFFQTATRTSGNGRIHHAINIITASGVGYTINNNIIGYANSSSTGVTTYAGNDANVFIAIEITAGTAVTSDIQGNTIAGISLNSTSTDIPAPGIFSGISVLAGNVNIGTTSGNTIGASTGTGSITVTYNNDGNYVTGIHSASTGTVSIQNNTIGSINVADPGNMNVYFNAINTQGSGANTTISANLIGSLSTANSITIGTSGNSGDFTNFNGITNAATGTASITNNTIQNITTYGTGATVLNGIINSGGSGTLNITGNSIISCSHTGSGAFIPINNSLAASTLNISSNIIRNLTKSASNGAFTGIQNTGAVTSAININSNQLGNASGGLITYSAATSVAFLGINNTGGTGACALSIQSNDIRGITHSVQGTNAHTYILNSAATLSQTISSNTFTNLNVNTTGAIIFISNNVVLSGTGTKNVQSNSISGTFTRNSAATSGSLSILAGTTTSVAGGVLTHANNNFSNITVSGAATITGWSLTNAGNATLVIRDNTFSNWSGGTGAITVMDMNLTNTNNEVKNNTISSISCACTIKGIDAGTGNNIIFSNTISTLTSTGGTTTAITGIANTAGTTNNIYSNSITGLTGNSITTGSVNGITITGGTTVNVYQNTIGALAANALTTGTINGVSVTSGTTINIYRNKIYDLATSSAVLTGTVNGARVSGSIASLTVNIYNNLIGDLRVTAASGTDLIRGISVISTGSTSTTNVYYNTIYINATSSGTNFGTSGVYHVVNTNATTSKLDLRNNLISNTSTPNGTGNTVVLRRSGTSFNNYASTSNNNLLHAGTPGTFRVIFFDGTNKDQTIAAYQTRVVSPKDAASVTDDMITTSKFLSITGSSANFLKIDSTKFCFAESNGANITGYTTDYKGLIRKGNTGSTSIGVNPDIGAHEFEGSWRWSGAINTAWTNTGNWYLSTLPSGSSITLLTGLSNYPVISSGTVSVNHVNMETGTSLTVTNATLQISGSIINSGTFTSTNGTIEFNGTNAQTIPASVFATNTIKNLTTNNAAGVTLSGTLKVTGILKATTGTFSTSTYLTLVSGSTQTALIDGTGAGSITGRVNMERYIDSAFGYKYLSSPFVAAKASELWDDLDFTASFPVFYRYSENQNGTGWVSYVDTSQLLNPMVGYAANFGPSGSVKTIDISGTVNNGAMSVTLYHNNKYQSQGFNLVGNPYPSPIDWTASSGWTKTNIDNAVYYFDAGGTNQYLGSYSSYVNGVSSNGTADNIIGSMQGFFVHVTNGTYPVTASLGFGNAIRVNNLTEVLHKKDTQTNGPLLRLNCFFRSNRSVTDGTVMYFNNIFSSGFDKEWDALKLMNTNVDVPSLYTISNDSRKLSINALPEIKDSITIFPLGLKTLKGGELEIKARDIFKMPDGLNIYLYDAESGNLQNLQNQPSYSFSAKSGTDEGRFSVVFSKKDIQYLSGRQNDFKVYNRDGKLYFALSPLIQEAQLSISNMIGQVMYKQNITDSNDHEININTETGIYIVTINHDNGSSSKKIFIPNK